MGWGLLTILQGCQMNAKTYLTITLLLLLAATAQAAEPIRLYSVSIAWQAGPTLTTQAPITDRWTFAGDFKIRHLKAELDAHAGDTLAWNVRTQLLQVAAKLGEWEGDLMDDVELVTAITGLESYNVAINYAAPVLTMDVPVKLGKESKTVRITVERLKDGLRTE